MNNEQGDVAMKSPKKHQRIHEIILEMAGGSANELIELLTRLRDERPELYRTFVRQSPCTSGPRDIAPGRADDAAGEGLRARAA
jgi:hypothetical protein